MYMKNYQIECHLNISATDEQSAWNELDGLLNEDEGKVLEKLIGSASIRGLSTKRPPKITVDKSIN